MSSILLCFSNLMFIIREVSESLTEKDLTTTLVISPPPNDDNSIGVFTWENFNKLKKQVTTFLLKIYGYSNTQRRVDDGTFLLFCVLHMKVCQSQPCSGSASPLERLAQLLSFRVDGMGCWS